MAPGRDFLAIAISVFDRLSTRPYSAAFVVASSPLIGAWRRTELTMEPLIRLCSHPRVLAAARDVKLRIIRCLLEMPEELEGVLHDECGTFIREGLRPRLQQLLLQATSAEPTNALIDPQESLQEIFDMLQVNRLGYVELFDQRPGATVGNMTIPRELWRNYLNTSSVMSAVDVPTFTAYRIDRTIWPDKATDATSGAYRFHKPEEALAIQAMMLGDSASITLKMAGSRKDDAKLSPETAIWARQALAADAMDFADQCDRAQELLDEHEEYLTTA